MVYHGRVGAMRQGRTEFPALVLKQHEDDGSLDLIVEFEAEDRIWEQRVRQYSEAQPGHCWSFVEPIDPEPGTARWDHTLIDQMDQMGQSMAKLRQQMYGDYEAPPKSMIEYLDDFDKRLQKLEKKGT